jgi:hypothetical protein
MEVQHFLASTSIRSGLAAHWLNPDYADAEVLIVLESDGVPGSEGLVVARLPVHRLVLTGVSVDGGGGQRLVPCVVGGAAGSCIGDNRLHSSFRLICWNHHHHAGKPLLCCRV